jgi:phage nucleotide-binding protein
MDKKKLMEQFSIRPVSDEKMGRTIMIYGDAGRGKTTLLNTIKEPTLIISCDCGEQVLSGDNIDVFPLVDKNLMDSVSSIKKFESFMDYLLRTEVIPWKYIALDNVSEIKDQYLYKLMMDRGVREPDASIYGDAGIHLTRQLRNIRNLNYKGVNVIYIAWENNEKVQDHDGVVISEKEPLLQGKTSKIIRGLVDFLMVLRVDNKGNRFLQLDGDTKYMAKKREEPGREYPNIIECPKGADDTLYKFFQMIGYRKDDTKKN